jgi:hypothetical protein
MSYNEKLQAYWRQYKEAGNDGPATAKDIAAWVVDQGLWKPRAADIVKVLAEDLSKAFREEYRTDAKGRRYRAKHPIRTTQNGAQLFLWDDMATASREHMERAFAWRRQQIVGDCHQLKIDVDVYNDQNPTAERVQLVLDFTNDVAELEIETVEAVQDAA